MCRSGECFFGRAAELLLGNAQDISLVQINFHLGPSLYYVSKEWVGGVIKIAIFADLQYYLG